MAFSSVLKITVRENESVGIGLDEFLACIARPNCLKRFIETLPGLWNKVFPSYISRCKKQSALEKLLVMYRENKATFKDVTFQLQPGAQQN